MKNYAKFVDSLYPENAARKMRFGEYAELAHAAMGFAGEAGEVLDLIKKFLAYGGEFPEEKFLEEMSDAFHYLQRLVNIRGLTMEVIPTYNTKKLLKRYPNGYTDEAAIQRRDKE